MSYQAIKNARIVSPDGLIRGTILYNTENGKIEAVEKEGEERYSSYTGVQVTDAGGAFAVPGGIDPHVHFGGFGEIKIADDFYSGSLAALAGGTTTVMDFCEPVKGESAIHCIEKRKQEARNSAVDHAFHFVMTREYKRQFEELEIIRRQGIRDFKLFTIYDNTDLSPGEIEEVVSCLGKRYGNDITFLVHSEDPEIIRRKNTEAGDVSDMSMLSLTRPPESEKIPAESLERIAGKYGASLCIAHVSAGDTVSLMEKGNTEGFCMETCPHYLEFTRERLEGDDGALYTMTPPLREQEDTEALWKGILEGRISMLSTDHCPYLRADKCGKTYNTVPCGVDGVQTRMIYLFSEGVKKRGLSMEDYVRLTSENAARFYHLYPRKGCLAPGSDADIVLISEDGETRIGNDYAKGNTDYTVYEGMTFQGRIETVIRRGHIVYDRGKMDAPRGSGIFLGERRE